MRVGNGSDLIYAFAHLHAKTPFSVLAKFNAITLKRRASDFGSNVFLTFSPRITKSDSTEAEIVIEKIDLEYFEKDIPKAIACYR